MKRNSHREIIVSGFPAFLRDINPELAPKTEVRVNLNRRQRHHQEDLCITILCWRLLLSMFLHLSILSESNLSCFDGHEYRIKTCSWAKF